MKYPKARQCQSCGSRLIHTGIVVKFNQYNEEKFEKQICKNPDCSWRDVIYATYNGELEEVKDD